MLWAARRNLTPNPFPRGEDALTPGADAVPSPAKKRERVVRYSGDIEGRTEDVGWLVFLGVLVVFARVLVVVGVGMLSYARFVALAYYYGVVSLVAIVVFVRS